jgi:hypothetical protein
LRDDKKIDRAAFGSMAIRARSGEPCTIKAGRMAANLVDVSAPYVEISARGSSSSITGAP